MAKFGEPVAVTAAFCFLIQTYLQNDQIGIEKKGAKYSCPPDKFIFTVLIQPVIVTGSREGGSRPLRKKE